MRKSRVIIIAGVIVALILVVAAATNHMPGMMRHSMGRHMQGMMGGVPDPYQGLKNPLPASAGVISRGAESYAANCAICHGKSGRGDGPGGANLTPGPADLASIMTMPVARDDYLFWTLSEGGKAFNTAMPAFKGLLDENARWQIIHYLRTLEP